VVSVERLLVGDMSVDDQCVAARRQDVGPDDSDVMPVTVVDRRRRINDDRPWPVARVEHIPWPAVNKFDGEKVAVNDAGPAVQEKAVRLQSTNLETCIPCNCHVRIAATIVSTVAVWLNGNALVLINVVALRRERLVLGWVTVRRYTILVFNQATQIYSAWLSLRG